MSELVSGKRIDLLLRGVRERDLFLREWNIEGKFLAAVGKLPADVNPNEVGAGQIVNISSPGLGETRLEAIQAALSGWIEGHDTSPIKRTAIPEYTPAFDKFAADIAPGALGRFIESSRTT